MRGMGGGGGGGGRECGNERFDRLETWGGSKEIREGHSDLDL